ISSIVDSNYLGGGTLKKVGNILYVSSYYSSKRFSTYDISNLSSPKRLDFISDTTNLSYMKDIEIIGDYAYVSNYDKNSIVLINIQNPTDISVEATLTDATNLYRCSGLLR